MSDQYIELMFKALSYAPGPFWLSLLFIPTSKVAMRIYDGFLILLAAHFVWLLVPMIPELTPLIAVPEFEPIYAKLTTKTGFLGSWNHMVLADLWIGRWITFDAAKRGASKWVRAIFILATMLFGPLGLATYYLFRVIAWRVYNFNE